MKIYREMSLTQFEPWSGAVSRYEMLTYDELDQLTEILEDLFPEGTDETALNDLLWFEFEWLCDLIGLVYDDETDEVIREDE